MLVAPATAPAGCSTAKLMNAWAGSCLRVPADTAPRADSVVGRRIEPSMDVPAGNIHLPRLYVQIHGHWPERGDEFWQLEGSP
jgi:hypothetical protein